MKYLSGEWLAAANDAVAGLTPKQEPAAIGYVVNDESETVAYTVVLGPDAVKFIDGTDTAGVVLTLSRELSVAIATNSASAQRAFLDGDIRVGGDVRVLLGNNDEMTAVDAALAELRSNTVY